MIAPGPMLPVPADRADTRRDLLDRVEAVRPTVVAHADAAEAAGTLPAPIVDALASSGLLGLKLPAVLGGAEADPLTQMDVLEAMARIDASTAWCLMVGATTTGLPAAFLPDAAIAVMFAGGRAPRGAGVIAPMGEATAVPGGYRVSGRWSFASGIRHAEWVSAGVRVAGSGTPPRQLKAAVRTAEVTIHDNWHVAGLRGTGSCDFSVRDLFVPADFAWDLGEARPRRGGALYRLGFPAFVANEHAAFALGVAGRALDTVIELAGTKRRGGVGAAALANRPVFQRAVAEHALRLRAARALAVEIFEAAWAAAQAGDVPGTRLQAETRAAAAHATDVAVEAVTAAFRFAGGSALYADSALQRCLRDMLAAAQHFAVSGSAYESLGQVALGLPGADPMA